MTNCSIASSAASTRKKRSPSSSTASARKCCSSYQWNSQSRRKNSSASASKAGEIHAVMGPNGSGKSTLSYALAGRAGYDVTKGSIVYRGEDLTALAPEERAAKGIFLAMQYPVEIPGVTTLTFLKA